MCWIKTSPAGPTVVTTGAALVERLPHLRLKVPDANSRIVPGIG